MNFTIITDQTITEQGHKSNKRKRDDRSTQKSLNSSMKSVSQLSIFQRTVPKKLKHFTIETMSSSNSENSSETNSDTYTLCKPSKYLKMPRDNYFYIHYIFNSIVL